jgi:hypothetical protein
MWKHIKSWEWNFEHFSLFFPVRSFTAGKTKSSTPGTYQLLSTPRHDMRARRLLSEPENSPSRYLSNTSSGQDVVVGIQPIVPHPIQIQPGILHDLDEAQGRQTPHLPLPHARQHVLHTGRARSGDVARDVDPAFDELHVRARHRRRV